MWMPFFILQLMTILVLIGMVFVILSEIFHGEISLGVMLLLLLVNFVGGSRLELTYIYIPHLEYQVKPQSPLWFSAACTTAIFHRNYFIRLYQENKSSTSKVKFRQVSNLCKRVLKVHSRLLANC